MGYNGNITGEPISGETLYHQLNDWTLTGETCFQRDILGVYWEYSQVNGDIWEQHGVFTTTWLLENHHVWCLPSAKRTVCCGKFNDTDKTWDDDGMIAIK